METTTEIPAHLNNEEPLANQQRPNGMTDEQIKYTLAALGRRKNDPEYLKRWEEGVSEYRRQIQEEVERELAKASGFLPDIRRPAPLSALCLF